MKKSVWIAVAAAFASFVAGSLKGDDLLEYLTTEKTKPLGEIQEEIGRPFNSEEIKLVGKRVMVESGHDLSDYKRIHGMTIEGGYIVTALGTGDRFIAQVFISKDCNTAECSKKL